MRFAVVASGSSGNCIYCGTKEAGVLIDAGVSCKKIEEGLNHFNIDPDNLKGVLITHEHDDHCRGLNVFLKKHNLPVYTTIETFSAMKRSSSGKGLPPLNLNRINDYDEFYIGDLLIKNTPTSHDAAHSLCFRIESEGASVAMATDLGKYDENIIKHLSGADLIYLESNYDPEMLLVGPYPYYLKQRIDGAYGHLSNEQSAELLSVCLHNGLKNIVLAHLSKENNFPEIALQTHLNMISEKWNFECNEPEVVVAKRDVPSVMYEL